MVIIDSLDSSTEGVGEQDSARPGKAIAATLDIARKENGPAILILGNTVKSGKHYRGSGVIGDRADIIYEVRDATDFKPSGKKPWWHELPPASEADYADRASRRQQKESIRLAFIPSKFRIGQEPEPFCLQINLPKDRQWTLDDVTEELKQLAATARERAEDEFRVRSTKAIESLVTAIKDAAGNGKRIRHKRALIILQEHGLTRDKARELIKRRNGKRWRLKELRNRRGKPIVLLPLGEDRTKHKHRRVNNNSKPG